MEHLGRDSIHGRPLFLTTFTGDWEWTDPAHDRFVLFIGADASTASDYEITAYAQASVAAGCAYVCCWGPDCGRVHDLFDLAAIDQTVYSTWHDDERLVEALYFAAFLTHLDPEEVDGADVSVLFTVQPPWYSDARTLLENDEELVRQFVEDE